MNDLALSLAREYLILAKSQNLVTAFTLHSPEQVECSVVGEEQPIVQSAVETAFFVKGLLAGARAAKLGATA